MQFVCLSGLPRSGSTLLSAILHQNPAIHAEGNSALCQMMWDLHQSCEINCAEQLLANRRHNTEYEVLRHLPHVYYRNARRPVIIDKCRSWCLPANQDLVRRFITDTPKTIVLTRPIDEIVASFAALYKANDRPFSESMLLREDSEPVMRSLRGVEWAKQANKGEFLFVTYDELVDNTDTVLDSIYAFLAMDRYDHDLTNIINEMPEDDSVYGLTGMHNIRPTISRLERV